MTREFFRVLCTINMMSEFFWGDVLDERRFFRVVCTMDLDVGCDFFGCCA